MSYRTYRETQINVRIYLSANINHLCNQNIDLKLYLTQIFNFHRMSQCLSRFMTNMVFYIDLFLYQRINEARILESAKTLIFRIASNLYKMKLCCL